MSDRRWAYQSKLAAAFGTASDGAMRKCILRNETTIQRDVLFHSDKTLFCLEVNRGFRKE